MQIADSLDGFAFLHLLHGRIIGGAASDAMRPAQRGRRPWHADAARARRRNLITAQARLRGPPTRPEIDSHAGTTVADFAGTAHPQLETKLHSFIASYSV
ncbi:MAG TPA: hypothetical protein VNN06_13370 [Ramlibacter sp.]|nr:hypothetical protein [Ramlibacter sp.]